jgi:drug/metabolite transporter (DMT)-like permease
VTLSVTFWGINFNVGKIIIAQISPYSAAAIRFFIASLFMIPILMIFESPKVIKEAIKRNAWGYFFLGIIGVAGYNGLFFVGLRYTTPINGALILATNPIITLLLSAVFLKTTFCMHQRIGLLLSFIGVIIVITHGSFNELLHLKIALGDYLIMAANICWSLYSVLGRRYLHHSSPLITTAMTMIAGSVVLILCAGFDLDMPLLLRQSWEIYFLLFYMAFFGSVLAYLFWNYGISHLGAGTTAAFFNLVPVVTMALTVFLGQVVTSVQIIGGLTVILGVLFTTKMINLDKIKSRRNASGSREV